MTDPIPIITHFYPGDTPLRRLLLKHSEQVRDKALNILEAHPLRGLEPDVVRTGAMLHDIGIGQCHAPGILCVGNEPYIAHGVIGARMLREYDTSSLETYARICERHTGAGITSAEVRARQLPIPERDYLPLTLAEKLICLADKFFSKSGDMREKSLVQVRRSLERFGPDTMARLEEMLTLFGLA